MKWRSLRWFVPTVALMIFGGVWFAGLGFYPGPQSVSYDFPHPPFEFPSITTPTQVPWTRGMTVRHAVENEVSSGLDLSQYRCAIKRWALWTDRRAINRMLHWAYEAVEWVPLEPERSRWKQSLRLRYRGNQDRRILESKEVSWDTPLKPGDWISLMHKDAKFEGP